MRVSGLLRVYARARCVGDKRRAPEGARVVNWRRPGLQSDTILTMTATPHEGVS